VNVIAPIRSEPGSSAWRQTTFYPFALTARYAKGVLLYVEQDSATCATDVGEVPLADVVATHDAETGEVVVLAVNRSPDAPIDVDVDLRAFSELRVADHVRMGGADLGNSNTETQPDRVVPQQGSGARVRDRRLVATLAPISWNLLRLVPVTA
jgi:alpha-N-arabinofuranosidase